MLNAQFLVQKLSDRLESFILGEQGKKTSDYDAQFTDKLKAKIAYVENLFYRFLEKIAQGEREREPTKISELCVCTYAVLCCPNHMLT